MLYKISVMRYPNSNKKMLTIVVFEHHRALTQPLGTGGAHIILTEDLEHARADESTIPGDIDKHQYAQRHDEVQHAVECRRGNHLTDIWDDIVFVADRIARGQIDKPSFFGANRKDQNTNDSNDKGRQRRPDKRDGGHCIIEARILAYGRVDAERDADGNRNQYRSAHQLQCIGQSTRDKGRNRAVTQHDL